MLGFLIYFVLILFECELTHSQDCTLYPKKPLGVSDKYVITDAQMTASSAFSPDTQAKYARLHYSDAFYWNSKIEGAGAWVAGDQDTSQYIQIDLKERFVIQSIGTQGRQGSRQWVEDYYVQYSDGDVARQWASYRDEYGQPNLFLGNTDDDIVHVNDLKYPIVARYIRINPQRWHNQISMRLELFGCEYKPYMNSFDGKTRIDLRLDQHGRATQTAEDNIRFRFKTTEINGLILYGDDGQNDYLSIEIYRARLRVNINLGTVVDNPEKHDNSIDAGSLLDDDQWHDVQIVRNQKILNISVDRIEMWRNLTASFMHMNMNRNLSLGGVANVIGRKGITVKNYFIGCLEEVWFNGVNMIRDAQRIARMDINANKDWQQVLSYPNRTPQVWWGKQLTESELDIKGIAVEGSLSSACPASSLDPTVLTFPGLMDSYLRIERALSTNRFQLTVDFRSFSRGGTIFYNNINGHKQIIWLGMNAGSGYLELVVQSSAIREVNLVFQNEDSPDKSFADGLWHSADVLISQDNIVLTLDKVIYTTLQRFTGAFNFDKQMLIGGGRPGHSAFRGCIRRLRIDNEEVDYNRLPPDSKDKNILNGTCSLQDQCMPNPCKHQAPCTQRGDEFFCDCKNTGYGGQLCHQSENPTSCMEVALFFAAENSVYRTTIDLDASGVLPPMNVTCDFTKPGVVRTLVTHDATSLIFVDGFEYPGSFRHVLDYKASRSTLSELVRRAVACEQSITYKCNHAKLLVIPNQGGQNYENRAYGWWIGRKGQPRYYWGGSVPGHQKCSCGVKNQCLGNSRTCNCDGAGSGYPPDIDSGLLEYKDDLPVLEVRLGDTGTTYDQKHSQFSVGNLTCDGDTLFDNTITFRREDANLELPAIYSETEFDVTFLFKTTIKSAVFLQNADETGFLEVRIRDGDTIRFSFNVGNGAQIVEMRSARRLNDDNWHIVRIERNRKESRMIVDDNLPVAYKEPTDRAFQMFRFTSKLIVGTTKAFTDGFLGCLGNLIINGVIQDMRGLVDRGEFTYGLSTGCQPKCASKPCRNRGECYEYYSHYYCECGLTPFRGYVCAREVGASFTNGAMLEIEFPDGEDLLGSLDEYIQIGFMTKAKQGHLMQLSSRDRKEYIIIKVNNNGGITIEFDVGFTRYEITTNYNIDLCNNQHHTVFAWRTNLGKVWHLKVDDYPEVTVDYSSRLSESSDARLDDPAFLYIGRNGSMKVTEGFEGCIFRIQVNNIFPLKMAFKDPPETNNIVRKTPPEDIREDKCGFEEIMPENEPIEIRPYPTIPPNQNFTIIDGEQARYISAIVGGVFAFILIALIIFLVLFCRHFTLDRGDYDTREAKGAALMDNPDLAIKYGHTGQPEVKGREWWI